MLRFVHIRMTACWQYVLIAATAAAFSLQAHAWSNHALGTWQALASVPEVADARPVRVESLEAFLAAEAPALERLLDAEEAWARRNVPHYPPRPDALTFKAGGSAPELRRRFLAALRDRDS